MPPGSIGWKQYPFRLAMRFRGVDVLLGRIYKDILGRIGPDWAISGWLGVFIQIMLTEHRGDGLVVMPRARSWVTQSDMNTIWGQGQYQGVVRSVPNFSTRTASENSTRRNIATVGSFNRVWQNLVVI